MYALSQKLRFMSGYLPARLQPFDSHITAAIPSMPDFGKASFAELLHQFYRWRRQGM